MAFYINDVNIINDSVNVIVDKDLSGHDFSKRNISNTTFVRCNMKGINLPVTILNMMNVVFIDCVFDFIVAGGNLFIQPLYERKYRLIRNDYSNISTKDLSPALDPHTLCHYRKYYQGYKIVKLNGKGRVFAALAKLRIDADTPAAIFKNSKCRAERAYVEWIRDFYGKDYTTAISLCAEANPIVYKVGDDVVADGWDPDIMCECSSGIHFFLTQSEAWGYWVC